MKVYGAENVPKSGPVLIAPIHVSHLDPPLVGCACPRAINFMAKEELFKKKFFSWLITSLGAFPVRRGETDSAAIRLAIDILKAGKTTLVFPEGTRGDGIHMGEVKVGIAMLAKRSGAAVVPVGLSGSNKMLPRGESRPRRAKLKVVFGEPLYFADFEEGNARDARELFTAELITRLHKVAEEAGTVLQPALSESQTSPRPQPVP